MTLLIQIVARTVTLSLAEGVDLIGSLDATWQVGSGRSFVNALAELIPVPARPSDIGRIAVATDAGSYTTERTALIVGQSLAWATGASCFMLPPSAAHISPSAIARAAAKLTETEAVPALFPSYAD